MQSLRRQKGSAAAKEQEAVSAAAEEARKEAMKCGFAVRLNSTPAGKPVPCLACRTDNITRSTACIRCSLRCCSLKCFDKHDCDYYFEAVRTMPKDMIAEEDVLTREEILKAVEFFFQRLSVLSPERKSAIIDGSDHSPLCGLAMMYPPMASIPWWTNTERARVLVQAMKRSVDDLCLLSCESIACYDDYIDSPDRDKGDADNWINGSFMSSRFTLPTSFGPPVIDDPDAWSIV